MRMIYVLVDFIFGDAMRGFRGIAYMVASEIFSEV